MAIYTVDDWGLRSQDSVGPVTPRILGGWSDPLAQDSIPVTLRILAGWSDPLSEALVPLEEGIFGGWSDPLAQMSVLLEPSEVIIAGWKRLAQTTVDLLTGIACSTDADCPEGYVCENGVCVKKGAAIPWTWLAIGGAAAGVILIASGIAKKKETK